jgi:hypothetical protein
MASCVLATTERTSLATQLNTDIGGGSLKIYTGSSPGPNTGASGTLLVTLTLPAAVGNSVASGVITLGSIAQANAVNGGTAGYGRILASNGTTVVMDLDVAMGSGGSINLVNTNIANGQPVSITSAAITVPAGT